MKILSAQEIRAWDQFTIAQEPVSSIQLMERAATQCVHWIEANGFIDGAFAIYCGKGNNGGDGLAIARLLAARQYSVTVHILEFGHKGTDDFQANLARLHQHPEVEILFIQSEEHFHPLKNNEYIIDALFGSGLNRALEGVTAKLVDHLNDSGRPIISIDIPSGLFTDRSSKGNTVIKATHTLSFQCLKPAFLFAENEESIGEWHILDIGLHPGFYPTVPGSYEWIDATLAHSIHKPRSRFSHKGNFGHALLVAGSHGKNGAAVLAARSCLRSGVGLLTCHVPGSAYTILQTAVPEAMVITDPHADMNTQTGKDLAGYETIGIGPGIGTSSETMMLLREIFDSFRSPVVLDADALNLLSLQKELQKWIPPGSILTPHPKEFERLFGETADDFEQVRLAIQKANELGCIIILKGHHSFIASPDGIARPAHSAGNGFFNSTGNAGMATAGSGDVLTGILTGLLAQGYTSIETAILGVYLHGMAGDLAASQFSMEAMVAGDIIENLGTAFRKISQDKHAEPTQL